MFVGSIICSAKQNSQAVLNNYSIELYKQNTNQNSQVLRQKIFDLMHVNYTQNLLNAAECCGSRRAVLAVCKDKDDIVFAAEARVVLKLIMPTIADVTILNTLT